MIIHLFHMPNKFFLQWSPLYPKRAKRGVMEGKIGGGKGEKLIVILLEMNYVCLET